MILVVLVNRFEKVASQKGYFSKMQFGFQKGVGCVQASLETINHMFEKGSKIFGCFLDVREAFDTVWIDCLLFKLFTELGIEGRMWLAIKDLYAGGHKSYILDHFLDHLMYLREQGKEEHLLHSCIKSTLTVYCMFYPITTMQFLSEACS